MTTICVIGDMQICPNMNLDHIEHIGRYIADKRPDVIVQIGDWWDMPSLSSYDRGKASFEGRRVKEDIEAGHVGMKRMLEPIKKLQQSQRYFKKKVYNPRMVMTWGNHDSRCDRAAQDNPELVGFIGTKELNAEQYGWEVYEFLKPVNIDGINFVHYLANPMTGRPYSGSAAGILKTVGASFVMGHKQVLDIAIRTTLEGKNQIGIINGRSYPHREEYKGWQGGNDTFAGITMLYEVKDGFALPSFISLDFLKEKYSHHD